MYTVALVTRRGQNNREHPMARHRRVKAEKQMIAWALWRKQKPRLPCTCVLTRVAPSNGLDDDNLSGSLKSVRDAIAEWLEIDDGGESVRWLYNQRRGPYAVEIDFLGQENYL